MNALQKIDIVQEEIKSLCKKRMFIKAIEMVSKIEDYHYEMISYCNIIEMISYCNATNPKPIAEMVFKQVELLVKDKKGSTDDELVYFAYLYALHVDMQQALQIVNMITTESCKIDALLDIASINYKNKESQKLIIQAYNIAQKLSDPLERGYVFGEILKHLVQTCNL